MIKDVMIVQKMRPLKISFGLHHHWLATCYLYNRISHFLLNCWMTYLFIYQNFDAYFKVYLSILKALTSFFKFSMLYYSVEPAFMIWFNIASFWCIWSLVPQQQIFTIKGGYLCIYVPFVVLDVMMVFLFDLHGLFLVLKVICSLVLPILVSWVVNFNNYLFLVLLFCVFSVPAKAS